MIGLQYMTGPLAKAAPHPKGTPTLIQDTPQGKPAGPHLCTRSLILSNKIIICRLTFTPTHKMTAPMWSKILLHVDTRWPPQDGQQERAVGRHQACKGGQLRRTRPAREGSWGANRLAGEQLDINQAGMGVVRG